jgi:hypothetical protein
LHILLFPNALQYYHYRFILLLWLLLKLLLNLWFKFKPLSTGIWNLSTQNAFSLPFAAILVNCDRSGEMHNYCTPHIIKENFENFLIHRCNYVLLSPVYRVRQVVKTPTIIFNNPVQLNNCYHMSTNYQRNAEWNVKYKIFRNFVIYAGEPSLLGTEPRKPRNAYIIDVVKPLGKRPFQTLRFKLDGIRWSLGW